MDLKPLLGALGALAVAAVLAACAGNTSSIPQSTSSIPLSGAQVRVYYFVCHVDVIAAIQRDTARRPQLRLLPSNPPA
jgi:hypothetical protein